MFPWVTSRSPGARDIHGFGGGLEVLSRGAASRRGEAASIDLEHSGGAKGKTREDKKWVRCGTLEGDEIGLFGEAVDDT